MVTCAWSRPTLALLGVLMLFTACVPRELELPRASPFRPYPHQALVRAGEIAHFLDDTLVVGTDTFRVFHGGHGGYVLHSKRHSEGERVELWLEVDAAHNPLHGWERSQREEEYCEWSFARHSAGIDVWIRGPNHPSGTRLFLGTPAYYAVRDRGGLAIAWGIGDATGAGELQVLEFSHCSNSNESAGRVGFTGVGFELSVAMRHEMDGHPHEARMARLRWPDGRVDELWISSPEGILLERRSGVARSALQWHWSATSHSSIR